MDEMLDTAEERDIQMTLSSNAKEFLADKGFDPVYGARQVKRTLRKYIEDPIAESLLKNQFKDGSHILVKRKGENLEFVEKDKAESPEKKKVDKPKKVNPEKTT